MSEPTQNPTAPSAPYVVGDRVRNRRAKPNVQELLRRNRERERKRAARAEESKKIKEQQAYAKQEQDEQAQQDYESGGPRPGWQQNGSPTERQIIAEAHKRRALEARLDKKISILREKNEELTKRVADLEELIESQARLAEYEEVDEVEEEDPEPLEESEEEEDYGEDDEDPGRESGDGTPTGTEDDEQVASDEKPRRAPKGRPARKSPVRKNQELADPPAPPRIPIKDPKLDILSGQRSQRAQEASKKAKMAPMKGARTSGV